MKKINLFLSIVLFSLLISSCGDTKAKPVDKNDSLITTTSNQGNSKTDSDTTPKLDIDPMALLKGDLLGRLLDREMKGMRLGMKGSEPILYTMYDFDEDGDKDLFMQVLFERGDVVLDAFVIYYNNEKPKIDPTFKPGISADNYHQLGQQGGEAKPCDICLFEKNEGNLFTFKDNSYQTSENLNPAPLKFKLTNEEYIGLKWTKQ